MTIEVVMGHLSPEHNFEDYNHFATLMATYALSKANITLLDQTLYNITGFANKKLKENNSTVCPALISFG
jgi:hypothetical protein